MAYEGILGNTLSLSDWRKQWDYVPNEPKGANQIYMFSAIEDILGDEDEPLRVDEVSASLYYLGFVRPIFNQTKKATELPNEPTRAIWKIVKVEKVGTEWIRTYADGDKKYDNVWDNRAALSYS